MACRTRNEADRYGAVRHSAARCGERRRSGLRGKELRGNAPRGNELRGNGTQPIQRPEGLLPRPKFVNTLDTNMNDSNASKYTLITSTTDLTGESLQENRLGLLGYSGNCALCHAECHVVDFYRRTCEHPRSLLLYHVEK